MFPGMKELIMPEASADYNLRFQFQPPYFFEQLKHLQVDRLINVKKVLIDRDPVLFSLNCPQIAIRHLPRPLQMSFPVDGPFGHGKPFAHRAENALVADKKNTLFFLRKQEGLARIFEFFNRHFEKIRENGFFFIGKIEVVHHHLKEVDFLPVQPLVAQNGFRQIHLVDVPAMMNDEVVEQILKYIFQQQPHQEFVALLFGFHIGNLLSNLFRSSGYHFLKTRFVEPLGVSFQIMEVVLRFYALAESQKKLLDDLRRYVATQVESLRRGFWRKYLRRAAVVAKAGVIR